MRYISSIVLILIISLVGILVSLGKLEEAVMIGVCFAPIITVLLSLIFNAPKRKAPEATYTYVGSGEFEREDDHLCSGKEWEGDLPF